MYAQTLPEIDATGSEAQNPFLLTFSIRNPSAWFEMSDVKYTCNLALSSGNTKITGGTLSRELAAPIGAGETNNFTCGAGVSNKSVTSAKVVAEVSYKTFWITREASKEFNWVGSPSRWEKEPVN